MATLRKCWFCGRRFEVDGADGEDGVAGQHQPLLGIPYVNCPPCLGSGWPLRYLDGSPTVPTVHGLPA